ncbi:MAG: NTP transferase domain-containing protein [Bacteroidia bacterium]
MIVGILLAAGEASRMGQPKQLLTYQGQTFIHHAVMSLLHAPCDRIIVVLGAHDDSVRPGLTHLPVKIMYNPDWKEGMSSSIKAGMSLVPENADAVMISLVDQPKVDANWFSKMLVARKQKEAKLVVTDYGEKLGVPALFSTPWLPSLRSLQGEYGARDLIRNNAEQALALKFEAAAQDIDTPEDYQQLLAE